MPTNINTEYQWIQLPHPKAAFGKLDLKRRFDNLLFTRDPSYWQKQTLT
jgi:hypothetical protein